MAERSADQAGRTVDAGAKDLQAEVNALERVLFRLASVDDARLLVVLDALLPQLLRLFPPSLDGPLQIKLKDKILEVITHIRTRLQAIDSPRLPLAALGSVVAEREHSAFTYNFAYLFLELGFAGASEDEQNKALIILLSSVGRVSSAQQDTTLRLLVRMLVQTIGDAKKLLESADTLSMDVVMDFLLDLVLYQPKTGATTPGERIVEVYGLQTPRLERLSRVKIPDLKRGELYQCQLNALKFVKQITAAELASGSELQGPSSYLHYIAGAASYHHEIKTFSEEHLQLLIKGADDVPVPSSSTPTPPNEVLLMSSPPAPSTSVVTSSPLESPRLGRDILSLILGSDVAQRGAGLQAREARWLFNRTRLSDSSLVQAISVLNASKIAASELPLMLQALCELMFGGGQHAHRPANMAKRIRLGGAKLCTWSFHHCALQSLISILAPVLLPTLLRELVSVTTVATGDTGNDSELVHSQLICHEVYKTVGVIASRAPSIAVASADAFQLLLMRCLAEEGNRGANGGGGAIVLSAFTALREAYKTDATTAACNIVQAKIVQILDGSELYDKQKRYERVRYAIAEWSAMLLGRIDSNDTNAIEGAVDLRFALLRACADSDKNVCAAAKTALYVQPLPPPALLARKIRALSASGAKDLTEKVSPAVAEQCLAFCEAVVKSQMERVNDGETVNGDVSELIAYFVGTMLSSRKWKDHDAASVQLCESVASSLVVLHGIAPLAVVSTLTGRARELVSVASRTTERSFLKNVSCLISAAVTTEDGSTVEGYADDAYEVLENAHPEASRICAAFYTAGSLVAAKGGFALSAKTSERLINKLADALEARVKIVSQFSALPRGEDALNAQLSELRSAMDAIAMASGSTTGKSGRTALTAFRTLLEWQLTRIGADGHLKQKLSALRRVALENVSLLLAQHSQRRAVKSVVEDEVGGEVWGDAKALLLRAVLQLGRVPDAELQFAAAHTLISFGSAPQQAHDAMTDVTQPTYDCSLATALLTQVLDGYAVSRHPVERRSATIWLLCMCAAGLPSPTVSLENIPTVMRDWANAFAAPENAQSLFAIHEFMVSMLNDTDPVCKESAVKALAYLRLHAPSTDLGDRFSDSLFRRLRCFRAFTGPSAADSTTRGVLANGENVEDDGDLDMESVVTPTSGESTAPNSGSAVASDTVGNAAYREVSNVAADVGDPELMYALLYLSTTNPIWDTFNAVAKEVHGQSTATFSFQVTDNAFHAHIMVQASRQWMTEGFAPRAKLLPWLFLLKHHAHPVIAPLMTNLWSLASGKINVSGSSSFPAGSVQGTEQEPQTLRQLWPELLPFVLRKLEVSRNFKYREAACMALVELLGAAGNATTAAASTANELRSNFTTLWKLAARAVDDVMEAVQVAALKLFRSLGELSLRLARVDASCRVALLDFLIVNGMASKNLACRALSIDLLLRFVKELDATALQDRVARLILTLLEYLSSLEMPELQYAQFHVDKKEELERLRVSLSQSGPVGQLLTCCVTQLKALAAREYQVEDKATASSEIMDTILSELCRGISNLLRFGVGLNTRVGTANLIVTLTTELPVEMRRCGGAELVLTKALTPYIGDRAATENDVYGAADSRAGGIVGSGVTDSLMLQSYCRAAAYLAPLVSPAVVRAYVRDGVFAFHEQESKKGDNENDDKTSTYASRFLMVSAMATKELVGKLPPNLEIAWYCTEVFPAAFIGQYAASTPLQTTWKEVLEELPPSIRYAETSLNAAASTISHLVRHPAWDTRRQALQALHAIFASGSGPESSTSPLVRITPAQMEQVWLDLLAAVPGRLWRGKGVILEALAAVAIARAQGWHDLTNLFLEECDRAWKNHDMEYLESALASLGTLSTAMPSTQSELRMVSIRELCSRFKIWARFSDDGDIANPEMQDEDMEGSTTMSPLMIKIVFETLRVVWPPSKVDATEPLASPSDNDGTAYTASAEEMLQFLDKSLVHAKFHAWSIRQAVFQALAAVVMTAPLRSFGGHQGTARLVHRCCGNLGVGDGKYWMVRAAAGRVLVALTSRHKNHALMLRVTVHREQIAAAETVLRRSTEPRERQVASEIFANLAALHE